jgi:hypothetical protein
MALRGASTTVDQDWIDWEGLARENAAVVCTVLGVDPPEDFGNGEVAPVRARVIILTGSQAGTVYESERVLKAGIRLKLQEVGDDIVGRLGVYGKRNHVGLNAENDGDLALAERALKKFGKPTAAKKVEEDSDDEPPF